MQLITEKTRYARFSFRFDQNPDAQAFCKHLHQQHGWQQFHFANKAWRFSDFLILHQIISQYPAVPIDADTKAQYEKYLKHREQTKDRAGAMALRDATVSAIDRVDLKLPLYEFQKIGVEFFEKSGGRALLADQMGTGKSAQTLGYIVRDNIKPVLIVCPASVKYSWENEVDKWTDLTCHVINAPDTDVDDIFLDPPDIIIMNYDILGKFLKQIASVSWGLMVCDESHYIKSVTSKRSKMVKILADNIDRVVLLSGTPFLNRPVELFTSLNIIDPYIWHDYWEFTRRYCNGHRGRWGYDASGASNIPELRKRISQYFLRRTKDEVLKELPKKIFIDMPVQLTKPILTEYNLASRSLDKYLKEYRGYSDEEIKESMGAEALVRLGQMRHIVSKGKLADAKQMINGIIDSGEKVIVFSCYKDTITELQEEFGTSAVSLTGSIAALARKQAIDSFQKDPKVQVFLGSIQASGVGITLTAAQHVLFIDYDWTPAIMLQAMDRAHRPGNTAESINIYQLNAKGTIDEYMQEILGDKQELFEKLISGEAIASTDVVKQVLERMGLSTVRT